MEPVIARRTVLGAAGIAALALAGCTTDGLPEKNPTTGAAPTPSTSAAPTVSHSASNFLLATLAHTDKIARIDPENQNKGAVEFLSVGAAPWGIGVHSPT